jgi:hypothetical protein
MVPADKLLEAIPALAAGLGQEPPLTLASAAMENVVA